MSEVETLVTGVNWILYIRQLVNIEHGPLILHVPLDEKNNLFMNEVTPHFMHLSQPLGNSKIITL